MDILVPLPQIVTLLLIASVAGILVERFVPIFKVPTIIAYIGVGVLIGPHALSINEVIFQENGNGVLIVLSSIALGFLIVTSFSGIHTANGRFHSGTCLILITASVFAFMVALASSALLLRIAPSLASGDVDSGEYRASVLIIALATIVTSVPFLTKIFIDLSLMAGVFASTVLISACILDISIWVVYPIADLLRSQGSFDPYALMGKASITSICALLLYIIFTILRRIYENTKLSSENTRSALFIITMSTFAALFTEYALGAGLLLGLLIAGLVLAHGKTIPTGGMRPLKTIAKWVFIPLYFILVGAGLRLDQSITAFDILVFVVWSSVIKITCVSLLHYTFSRKLTSALVTGIVFNTRGGPGLVLATVAYSMELINVSAFSAFIAATIITAPVTEIVLRFYQRRKTDSDLLAQAPVKISTAKLR